MSLCTTVVHNTAHRTVPILFPLILHQTVVISQTMSSGGEGDGEFIGDEDDDWIHRLSLDIHYYNHTATDG